jgi:CelD/BcsL family acetyltransferase involved in cellulose biosynthesis
MGAEDSGIMEFAVEQLLVFLKDERLDLVVYHGLRWSSPIRRLLHSKPRFLCRDLLVRARNNWVMQLPQSLEELFQTRMTKKRRYWAKRRIRFLERAYPNRIRYVSYSSNAKLADLLRDISTIARQSHLWGKRVGYQELPEQKNQIELFARKGLLRAVVLYIEEQPISYWVGFRYAQGLYLYYTGFVPKFRRDEPGTLALYQMIARACEEGVEYMYLRSGQYEYKQRLSTEHFEECNLLVFSGSLRGKLLNCVRTLLLGPLELVRCTIEALGMGPAARRLLCRRD